VTIGQIVKKWQQFFEIQEQPPSSKVHFRLNNHHKK